ncbi:hypothetical protein PENTCL1PPCAC_7779 [Pristionchus entomophagus]|uniref:Uncharacterized protein n=1 Tax=Pristionchus entomophagus TaxID=358040 RepID=A0AAV5SW60_9BILA|nr:hypothetical protein PENTCL1PPCAC_7779 [Pristionchus entomophagus]
MDMVAGSHRIPRLAPYSLRPPIDLQVPYSQSTTVVERTSVRSPLGDESALVQVNERRWEEGVRREENTRERAEWSFPLSTLSRLK